MVTKFEWIVVVQAAQELSSIRTAPTNILFIINNLWELKGALAARARSLTPGDDSIVLSY
jgi:hypothetical protein